MHRAPTLERRVLGVLRPQVLLETGHASVVHEDVQPPKAFLREGDGALPPVLVADVQVPVGRPRPDGLRHRRALVVPQVRGDHEGPFSGQELGRRPPDAASGPRDERRLAFHAAAPRHFWRFGRVYGQTDLLLLLPEPTG